MVVVEVEPSLGGELSSLSPVDEYVEVCSSVAVSLSPNETESEGLPGEAPKKLEELLVLCAVIELGVCQEKVTTLSAEWHGLQDYRGERASESGL